MHFAFLDFWFEVTVTWCICVCVCACAYSGVGGRNNHTYTGNRFLWRKGACLCVSFFEFHFWWFFCCSNRGWQISSYKLNKVPGCLISFYGWQDLWWWWFGQKMDGFNHFFYLSHSNHWVCRQNSTNVIKKQNSRIKQLEHKYKK